MQKLVNGELVDLTPQEIAERQAEEAAYLAKIPLETWKREMQESDVKVPRVLEDIYDALTDEQKNKIAKETKDLIENKKTKRANRP